MVSSRVRPQVTTWETIRKPAFLAMVVRVSLAVIMVRSYPGWLKANLEPEES